MPQFYATDNIQRWFEVLVIERLDYMDIEDVREFQKHELTSAKTLREWCREYADVSNDSLMTAIINTVDWDEVYQSVLEYCKDNEEEWKQLENGYPSDAESRG